MKGGLDPKIIAGAVEAVQRLLDQIPVDPLTAKLQEFQRETE